MTVRRFTAWGLVAFMLHLNVVRADAACATHQMPAHQNASMQHDMDGLHGGHDRGRADGAADATNCETPTQTDCCQAVTSCSPALGFGVEKQIASWIPTHDAAGARFFARPLSRNTAPEPPPPRV